MKLTAIALFGAGYVVGTRAGRERYDQLVSLARRVADHVDDRAPASGATSAAAFTERLAQRLDESAMRHNGHAGPRPVSETLEREA